MPKFKKGDVVRLDSDDYTSVRGTRLIVREDASKIPYCANANGEHVGTFKEYDLTPLTGTDAAVKGSVLVNKDGEERTVIGVCGDALFVANEDGDAGQVYYSYAEIEEMGWTLKEANKEAKSPGYAYDENGKVLGKIEDGKIIPND